MSSPRLACDAQSRHLGEQGGAFEPQLRRRPVRAPITQRVSRNTCRMSSRWTSSNVLPPVADGWLDSGHSGSAGRRDSSVRLRSVMSSTMPILNIGSPRSSRSPNQSANRRYREKSRATPFLLPCWFSSLSSAAPTCSARVLLWLVQAGRSVRTPYCRAVDPMRSTSCTGSSCSWSLVTWR